MATKLICDLCGSDADVRSSAQATVRVQPKGHLIDVRMECFPALHYERLDLCVDCLQRALELAVIELRRIRAGRIAPAQEDLFDGGAADAETTGR